MVKGVDVSEFQPGIDWTRAKVAGINFAMLRAGYGKGNADACFAANIAACEQVGMPVGITWMAYPLSAADAAREAEYCIAAIKDHQITYPVAYDLEGDSVAYAKKCGVTLNKTLATTCAIAFCEAIKAAGYTPAVYTNADYASHMFDLSQLPYDIWYAYYQPAPDRDDVSIWQYSNAGVVDGIKGSVDMDMAYKDYGTVTSTAPTAATPAAETEVCTVELPILKRGSTGDSVIALQILLSGYGYDPNGIDGVFGPGCESSVNAFQSKAGLDADGCVGPLTWAALLK